MTGTNRSLLKACFPKVKRMGVTDRQCRLWIEGHSHDILDIEMRDFKQVSTYVRAF